MLTNYSRENEEIAKNAWLRRLSERRYTRCPPQVELPPIHVNEVQIMVTHEESPSQFFAVYMKNYGKVEQITEQISAEFVDIPLPRSKILPNSFCLAPFTDPSDSVHYYRGKILITNPIGEALV